MSEPLPPPSGGVKPATIPKQTLFWIEQAMERFLFSSRWFLAPIYVGLALSLLALLYKFCMRGLELIQHVSSSNSDDVIIGILSLVDLSFVGNLVVIVMLTGYKNFVSNLDIDDHRDKPAWIEDMSFGDLKIKLMTSIVAISAIQVLEVFMKIDTVSDRTLMWGVAMHVMFVVTAVLLTLMDRLQPAGSHH